MCCSATAHNVSRDLSFPNDGTIYFAHSNGAGKPQSCQRMHIEPKDQAACIALKKGVSDVARRPSGIWLPGPTKDGLCTECWFFL